MREMSWSLALWFVLTLALPVFARHIYYDDQASQVIDERGGRDETDNQSDNQMYEEVSKRALVALSRFKTFASALSPDIHRFSARSYFSGRDLPDVDRRGRPAQNPMRFGR